MNKTTPEHRELFKKECQDWIKILGLQRYKIYYEHKLLKEYWFASSTTNINGCVATLRLNKNWGNTVPTEELIKQSAFHEICEVMMARLIINAQTRFASSDDIEEATHEIIRTLENVLFPLKEKIE